VLGVPSGLGYDSCASLAFPFEERLNWSNTHSSLVGRLRDHRDETAWRRFDRLYGPLMVRYACRRGLSLQDAEDVRQVVLMSLVRAMPAFVYNRERGRFRSYLGRALGNAIQRARRRPHLSREWLVEDPEPVASDHEAPAVDEIFEREWVDHHLRTAMERLRRTGHPRAVQVFSRLLAGALPEAVASELGMSVDAVRKTQQRMRRLLQDAVRAQVAEESSAIEKLARNQAS
jgi:RNA polymerase sigma factor (sigma-70 family)